MRISLFASAQKIFSLRYARITGCVPEIKGAEAVAIYNNPPETGSFECSNPLLNQLQQNIYSMHGKAGSCK